MAWVAGEVSSRSYARSAWNESAAAHRLLAPSLDRFNPALLSAAAPRRGERVLDVASGLGEPALTLAQLVAPGAVLGIDATDRTVEMATVKARERSASNLGFRVMQAERLLFPDGSFHLVTSRFGLQLMANPEKALSEMHRVLSPRGRVAASVWGPPERCPVIEVFDGAMREHVDPGVAGYGFGSAELSAEGALLDRLEDAGFEDAHEERVVQMLSFSSADECVRAFLAGSFLGHSLRDEEASVQRAVLRDARESLIPWTRNDGVVTLPGEAIVARARKSRH